MKLLLTGAFKYTEEQLLKLKNAGFETTFVQNELEEITVDVAEFDAVVCNGLFLHNSPERFENLKAVQLTSAGFERAPVGYFAANGISLFNAKGVYSIPMAEWVILKTLEIYKKAPQFRQQQKKKIWQKHRDLLEINGKRILIVGTGSVGLECAKRFCAFGARVTGADIFDSKSEFIDEFFYMDSLDEALKSADVVVLTLPLTDSTRKLFSSEKLSAMKDGSVLINVARGEIIDEAALVKCLEEKKFLGVALDVFESEPLDESSPLWSFDRVLITPHNSFVSDTVADRMFSLIYKNLTEFDFGKRTK